MQSLTGGLTPADFEDSAARGGIHRCVLAGGDLVGIVNVTWNWELIVAIVPSHRRRGVAGEACRQAMREACARSTSPIWAKARTGSSGDFLARSLGFVESRRTADETFFTSP
ncbi:MAG: hypothetical protein U0234_32995 [Sandaracinus sp.]